MEDKKGAKLTNFGTNLALAFDESFNNVASRSALKELCSDVAEVSVGAIRLIADAVRLRPVSPSEPEHKLLVELLLRMETGDDRVNAEYDLNRSRSLALFMEIAEQAQGTLSSVFRISSNLRDRPVAQSPGVGGTARAATQFRGMEEISGTPVHQAERRRSLARSSADTRIYTFQGGHSQAVAEPFRYVTWEIRTRAKVARKGLR